MNNKIIFVNRSKQLHGISIEKVFLALQKEISNEYMTKFSYVPYYRVTMIKILRNIIFCRELSKKNDNCVYHITGDIHYVAIGLPRNQTILTIHDLVLLQTKNKFKKIFFKLLWFEIPLKRCRYITAISEKTYIDLISLFPKFKQKIRLIHDPLVGDYHFSPFQQKKLPIILQVGTRDNKNLIRCAYALKGINCIFHIIGDLNLKQKEALQENLIEYVQMSNISEEELKEQYEKCDLVLFVSLYEGFGLPVIESQAMGRPVVTSNISPMKEIAGQAAYLVDPYSVSSIHEGILHALTDKESTQKMIENGKINIRRFSLPLIAEQYCKLYQAFTRMK